MPAKNEVCQHGEPMDETCDKCWNGRLCRKCRRQIKEGEIAWWAPGRGPQCCDCREKVPTLKQAIENLNKCLEELGVHIDETEKKNRKKFRKTPQRES